MAPIRNALIPCLACAVAAAVVTGCAEKDLGRAPASSAAAPATAAERSANALEGLSAQQILDRAAAAMKGLSSATMTVRLHLDGRRGTSTTAMTDHGACVGRVETESTDETHDPDATEDTDGTDGIPMDMITVGGYTYTRFDLSGSTGGTPHEGSTFAGGLLDDHWVRTPVEPGRFEEGCDLDALVDSLLGKERSAVDTVGVPAVVDGRSVIPVSARTGEGSTSFYVMADGEPYFARIVLTGEEAGTADFTDFDKPVNAVAPTSFEIADIPLPDAGGPDR